MSRKDKLDIPDWVRSAENAEALILFSEDQDSVQAEKPPEKPVLNLLPQSEPSEQIASEPHLSQSLIGEKGEEVIKESIVSGSEANKTSRIYHTDLESLKILIDRSFKDSEKESQFKIFQSSEEKTIIVLDHLVAKGGNKGLTLALSKLLKDV